LDGGQITGEVLSRVNRRDGKRWGHIVSMVTAGVLALYTLSRASGDDWRDTIFPVLFFGSFAFANFQILQAYHQRHLMYGPDEDADWWAR
jgi:hypothetical protein